MIENQTIQKEYENLQAGFRNSLPQKFQDIETAMLDLLNDSGSVELLKRLQILVHELVRLSESFGLQEVSDDARIIDYYIDDIWTSGLGPHKDVCVGLIPLIDSLKTGVFNNHTVNFQNNHTSNTILSRVESQYRHTFILIGDEDISDITRQLTLFGYSIRVVDRATLLDVIREDIPRALILHTGSRENDFAGFRIAEEIIPGSNGSFPLIFVSDDGGFDLRLMSVKVGASAFYQIPFDVTDLVDHLDILVSRKEEKVYQAIIVEEDDIQARYYTAVFKKEGIESEVISDQDQLLKTMSELQPDVILLNLYPSCCEGTELARVIRQIDDFVGVPIIFLTADRNLDRKYDALEIGADDFLSRPIHPHHLVSSVKTRIHRHRALRSQMIHDRLSNLLNHTSFEQQLHREIMRSRRYQGKFSLAILDLDHFKSINDSFGHATGDRVIKTLSRMLKQRLRRTDIIGRLGGEEFGIILLEVSPDSAREVLDDIRTSFENIPYISTDGTEFCVTFSCGISSFPECDTFDGLHESADRALYQAKAEGRNRVVLSNGNY